MGSKCMSCPEMASQLATGTECFTRERNRSFLAAVTKDSTNATAAWRKARSVEREPTTSGKEVARTNEQAPRAPEIKMETTGCVTKTSTEETVNPSVNDPGIMEDAAKSIISLDIPKARRSPLPDLMERSPEDPPPSSANSFPSIPDTVLQSLSLVSGHQPRYYERSNSTGSKEPSGGEELTAKELEDKFNTLAIAFRTDKGTLSQRVELQRRQRDQAERNVLEELASLRKALNKLYALCGSNAQLHDQLVQVQQQVEVVQQAAGRVVSRAEHYGAVQQEVRMSRVFDVMVAHVENLRRLHEREQAELRETRQVLLHNKLMPPSTTVPALKEDKPTLTRRRASVATIQRPSHASQEVGTPQRPRLLSAAAMIQSRVFSSLERRASFPCENPSNNDSPEDSPSADNVTTEKTLEVQPERKVSEAKEERPRLNGFSAPDDEYSYSYLPLDPDEDIYIKESALVLKWREVVAQARQAWKGRPRELQATLLAARYCAACVLVAAGVLALGMAFC